MSNLTREPMSAGLILGWMDAPHDCVICKCGLQAINELVDIFIMDLNINVTIFILFKLVILFTLFYFYFYLDGGWAI
jgi:hypothetical protein